MPSCVQPSVVLASAQAIHLIIRASVVVMRHVTSRIVKVLNQGNGQISSVALLDSRSVAATAINGGALTAATDIEYDDVVPAYHYDDKPYESKVYSGFNKPNKDTELVYGPSIKPWPSIEELTLNVLLKVAAYIDDPVTTTDELIPSGENIFLPL